MQILTTNFSQCLFNIDRLRFRSIDQFVKPFWRRHWSRHWVGVDWLCLDHRFLGRGGGTQSTPYNLLSVHNKHEWISTVRKTSSGVWMTLVTLMIWWLLNGVFEFLSRRWKTPFCHTSSRAGGCLRISWGSMENSNLGWILSDLSYFTFVVIFQCGVVAFGYWAFTGGSECIWHFWVKIFFGFNVCSFFFLFSFFMLLMWAWFFGSILICNATPLKKFSVFWAFLSTLDGAN